MTVSLAGPVLAAILVALVVFVALVAVNEYTVHRGGRRKG